MKAETQEGQCRCGAVRFTATGRPLITMACHCRGCQRMSASAFSLSSLYDSDRFAIIEGDPVLGGLKGPSRHFFCPSCLSWIFTRPEGLDAHVNIRSTLFDRAAEHRPYVEMHWREALPAIVTGAVERFESVPEDDQFGPLVGAYAQWSGSTAISEEERR